MKRLALCSLSAVVAACVCAASAPQVQFVEVSPQPVIAGGEVSTQQMVFVHNIEQSNKVTRQNASLLMAPHAENQEARIKFLHDQSWIEVMSDGAAILLDSTHVPDPEFPFNDGDAPAQPINTNQQNPTVSFMTPWWVIIKENIEIGADGTRLFIHTSKPTPGTNRMVALLIEGGPARIFLIDADAENKNRKNTLVLENVGQYYDVVWENVGDAANPRRVSVATVNGQTPPAAGPEAIKPTLWPEFDRTIVGNQAIVDRGKLLETRRQDLRNAPSIRSLTP